MCLSCLRALACNARSAVRGHLGCPAVLATFACACWHAVMSERWHVTMGSGAMNIVTCADI